MRRLFFITHADVVIDPEVPVPDWSLSDRGRDRHRAAARAGWSSQITSVYASAEQKAQDGADILAQIRGCPVTTVEDLHENDRSSTGYLPGPAFQAMADAFFAQPETSVRGWERAVDAQSRIVTAVQDIATADTTAGDIAIVAHGGVGALFLCNRMGHPISRALDQPGTTGGNVVTCALPDLRLLSGWHDIGIGPPD